MVGGAIDTSNPVVVVLVACAIPIFVGVGVWMIVRPAQAFRASYWALNRQPPSRDAVWFRLLGCIVTAFSIAFAIAFVADVLAN